MDPNSNFLHDLGNPLQPATLAAPKRKEAPTPLEDTSAKKYKLDESILEQVQGNLLCPYCAVNYTNLLTFTNHLKQHTGGTLPDAVTELLMSQLVAFPQLSFASVPEQSEDKDGEKKGEHEIFEVEQVLGVRAGSYGRLEYLLKWQNYGPESNSWEPADNIQENLIQDFTNNNRQAVAAAEAQLPAMADGKDQNRQKKTASCQGC